MRKSPIALTWSLLLTVVSGILASGCPPAPTPRPTSVYSVFQLEYRLFASFPDFFWCDPDFYPVAREGQEEKSALEQFATIRANASEFSAISTQLSLPDRPNYTDAEKLAIYREHKKLTYAVQMTASGNTYGFVLRRREGQGERIEGTITPAGEIKVTKREPSFNTCPICLAKGTLIDTPDGPVPVEQIHEGMDVWTLDESGKRVAAAVIKTVTTPVPASFRVVQVTLRDGRSVTASPGHPTAEGRPLGDYQVGDALDGAVVVSAQPVAYDGGATYDILPSGATGLYWANGVLLKSTLVGK